MTDWRSDELDKIGRAEELEITTVRRDGTLRKPVTIWVVREGDDLYVRSGYGNSAAWYRGTQLRREGRILAGGIKKDVAWMSIPLSMTRSTSYTAPNIAVMVRAGSIQWWPRRRGPRQSGWCRGKRCLAPALASREPLGLAAASPAEGSKLRRGRRRRAALCDLSGSRGRRRWSCRLKGRDALVGIPATPRGTCIPSPRARWRRSQPRSRR
jgi:hypothetical protein